MTAASPYADITPALMHVVVEAGADVIELGLPLSHPSVGCPVIQPGSELALRLGTGLPQVLDHVRQFRQSDSGTPVLLIGYANPIKRYDQLRQKGAFAEDAARTGVDGILVVDYPPEVSGPLAAQLRRHGLDLIFLLGPTSTVPRIRQVAERASGYVYGVSAQGATGALAPNLDQVWAMLARIRRHVYAPSQTLANFNPELATAVQREEGRQAKSGPAHARSVHGGRSGIQAGHFEGRAAKDGLMINQPPNPMKAQALTALSSYWKVSRLRHMIGGARVATVVRRIAGCFAANAHYGYTDI